MSDVITIIKKELWEIGGDWHSFYGVLIQALIVIGLCGVMVPGDDTTVWSSPGRLIIMFGIFPSVLAATFSADSFAGERERKTLETLMASPISDRAVFCGKALTALLISVGCAALTMVAGLTTTAIRGEDPIPFVGPLGFLVLVGGAVAFALNTTAIATWVSTRVRVARAAQQISSMVSLLISLVFATLMRKANLPMNWPTLLRVEGVLLVVGLALLGAGLYAFSRARTVR